jgi:hypothetical protein
MHDPQSAPPKRGRGRPRRTGPAPPKEGAIVSAWLPTADYDKLYKKAQANEVSMSAVVRAWIRQQLK